MLVEYPLFNAVGKSLLLPPIGLIVLVMVGLVLAARHQRSGMMIAWIGSAALFGLSLPIVAMGLSAMLEPPPPFSPGAAHDAQAIVILGGGLRHHAADYGGDTLAPLTLERVRYGARIARQTGLPVMVSGGAPQGGAAEAPLMRAALEQEFGVKVQWTEPASRNTHENAVRCAALLRTAHIARVVLVTHGVDMRRALREFAAQGIDAVPAATGLVAPQPADFTDYVPGIGALQRSYFAIYEIVANAVYALGPAR